MLDPWARNIFDSIDMRAFRDNSKQLDDLYRGDFSSIRDELKKAFPNSENIQERFVRFAGRVAQEQATLYTRPPRREWSGVNRAQRDKLDEIWQASGFDDELQCAHERLVLQQTMVCTVTPDGLRRYRLHQWAPHEFAVKPAHGSAWADVTRAQSVEVLWPIAVIDEQVWYGIARIDATGARIVTNQGQEAPLFPGLPAGAFGGLPLFALRSAKPSLGRFAAPIAEDVLATTIAMCLAESDLELNLHYQAWGQRVIEPGPDAVPPQNMVDKLPVGVDRIAVLPAPGAKMVMVQGQPAVQAYIDFREHILKTAATMHDMSPSRFSKANTAQTGAARAADMKDREEARAAYKRIMIRAEREMLAMIVRMSNLYGDPLPLPETARLEAIHYAEYEPPADPLAEAQAHAETDRTGETSPVLRVAARHNIPLAAAERRLVDNLKQMASIRAEVAPKQAVDAEPPSPVEMQQPSPT